MTMHAIPYIHTPAAITVFLDNLPSSFANDTPEYELLARAIYDPETTEETLREIIDHRSTAYHHRWDSVLRISDRLSVVDDVIHWDDKPMHNTLAVRLLALIKADQDTASLEAFQSNLDDNPDWRVRQQLFDFLEYGQIPITSDGHFLVYKYVREDYMDAHSGKFYNGVGAIVEMPRRDVDSDPTRTCSAGLHVCSWEYLPRGYTWNHKIMVCKVNPRDVVAVPIDYNNTKMRTCRYEVVGEVTAAVQEERNILSERPFTDWNTQGVDTFNTPDVDWDFEAIAPPDLPSLDKLSNEGRFELVIATDYWTGSSETVSTHGTISEGMQALMQYCGRDDFHSADLVDKQTDNVIASVYPS